MKSRNAALAPKFLLSIGTAHVVIVGVLAGVASPWMLPGAMASHCLLLGFWVFYCAPASRRAIEVPLAFGFITNMAVSAGAAFGYGRLELLAWPPVWILTGLFFAPAYLFGSGLSVLLYSVADSLTGPLKLDQRRAPETFRSQFSLSQLLLWMVLVALSLSLATFLAREVRNPSYAIYGLAVCTPAWAAASMVALLRCDAPPSYPWWRILSALMGGLVGCLAIKGQHLEILLATAVVAVNLVGTTLLVRACGYRLYHASQPSAPPEPPAPSPSDPAAPGP